MAMTQKVLATATRMAVNRARKSGKTTTREIGRQLAMLADEALVEVGRAAKRRQRRRKVNAALKVVGKTALIGGTAAATVLAVRAAAKRK